MVKPGYKETEIGVIPEEWNTTKMKAICSEKLTYGINASAESYMPPLPNYIRITDITDDGKFSQNNRASVICTDADQDKFKLKVNDIVLARTGASVGKSYLYNPYDGELVYAGFLIKASIDSQLANSKYVFSVLHTSRYWEWVATTSMRSGQPGINGNEYGNFVLALPPLKEQQKIAEALSDMDELIASLEKLIAKKKAIKQGTMQELLTGKKRLPGFDGKWEKHQLGEFVECIRGVSYNGQTDLFESESDKTIRLLRSNNIQNSKFVSMDVQYITRQVIKPIQILQQFDIMVCMANGSKSLVGKSCLFRDKLNNNYTFGAFMSCVRTQNSCANTHYIFYTMNSYEYWEKIKNLLSGSSINNLSPKDILSMEFNFPSCEEQQAIASILSDMDAEIEALEQKLAKCRQTKQGMMQQLLTGKIRLV